MRLVKAGACAAALVAAVGVRGTAPGAERTSVRTRFSTSTSSGACSRPSTSSSTTIPRNASPRWTRRAWPSAPTPASRGFSTPVPREEAAHPLRLARATSGRTTSRAISAKARAASPRRCGTACCSRSPATSELRARARARNGARVPVRHLRARARRRGTADARAGRPAAVVHGRHGRVPVGRPEPHR